MKSRRLLRGPANLVGDGPVNGGLATLREVQKPGFYDALGERTRSLVNGSSHIS